jgi:hypothetical protein
MQMQFFLLLWVLQLEGQWFHLQKVLLLVQDLRLEVLSSSPLLLLVPG